MVVNYIVNHQAEFWLLMGFVLLALEVFIGFTAGVFLFAGLAALITGGLMNLGVLPETWIAGIASTGVGTGVITALLWKQLKKLQGNKPIEKDNSSDLIGYSFVLENEIAINKTGTTQYSGIKWRVEIALDAGVELIEQGKRVTVSEVDVGVFKVKKI